MAGENEAAGVEQMKFYEVAPHLSMTQHAPDWFCCGLLAAFVVLLERRAATLAPPMYSAKPSFSQISLNDWHVVLSPNH